MKLTPTEFTTELAKIVSHSTIYGAQFTAAYVSQRLNEQVVMLTKDFGLSLSLYLKWEQAWAVGANLNVSVRVARETRKTRNGPEEYLVAQVSCEINCGTTSRNVATALAFSTLFRQVTELAALIETALNGTVIDTPVESIAKTST